MNSIFFFSLIRYKKVLGQFTLYKPSKHDNKNFVLNQQNMYNIYIHGLNITCVMYFGKQNCLKVSIGLSKHKHLRLTIFLCNACSYRCSNYLVFILLREILYTIFFRSILLATFFCLFHII